MSANVNTKPRAQRIDSQDEAVASSVEATERREAAAQDQVPAAADESPVPKPRTTRNRLLTITQRFATFRTRLPRWSLLVGSIGTGVTVVGVLFYYVVHEGLRFDRHGMHRPPGAVRPAG